MVVAEVEYEHYPDTGCDLADSCLNCPLPRCVEDMPRGKAGHRQKEVDSEIASLHEIRGVSVIEIARRFNVTKRTVQRSLKRTRRFNGHKGR